MGGGGGNSVKVQPTNRPTDTRPPHCPPQLTVMHECTAQMKRMEERRRKAPT